MLYAIIKTVEKTNGLTVDINSNIEDIGQDTEDTYGSVVSEAAESPYRIRLPVFEGPLDLLLHLIKENKIDIYDIPIALITEQYLEYLALMKDLDLDIAGEFLLMAATLIHIKSRMLLPVDETQEEPETDPRAELVQRLLEYQSFKETSGFFREREDLWKGIFYRYATEEAADIVFEQEPMLFELSLFDLIAAFKRLLEKAPEEIIEITREVLTVKDRIAFILESLSDAKSISFEGLFKGDVTRPQLIVTFLALLEILKLGIARVYQEKEFGTIWILKQQAGNTAAEV